MPKHRLKRLWALSKKELLIYRRDPNVLRSILLMPLIQLTIFGFVIQTRPIHTPISIVNFDPSPASRQLISRIQQAEAFRIHNANSSPKQAQLDLIDGNVSTVLTIPPRWSESLTQGRAQPLAYEVDGGDAIAAQQTVLTLQQLLKNLNDGTSTGIELTGSPLTLKPGSMPTVVSYMLYNPDQRTREALIPPMIGIVLTIGMVQMMAMGLVREREMGTLEVLLQTPSNLTEIIISKIIPNLMIGMCQLCFFLLFMVWVLGIQIQGSVMTLALVSLPFIFANLAIGLSFSVRAKTQFSAMTASMVIVLPSIMLSGTIFPVYSMPTWAQWISAVLPTTYYAKMAKAIILKGAGIGDLLPPLGSLMLLSSVLILISMIRLRRHHD